MKKLLLLICFVIGGIAIATAQNYNELVYLKDGCVIRGVIVEQIPNVSLKIKTTNGDVYDYDIDEIDRIVRETSINYQGEKSNIMSRRHKGKYKGYLELGVGVGPLFFEDAFVSLLTSHGAQVSPRFYIGAGTGFTYHYDVGIMLPVFADMMVKFSDKRIAPYFATKMGFVYSGFFAFYFNPAFGFDVPFDNSKCGLFASLGYTVLCDGGCLGDISMKCGFYF